jgi:hypothetical protein
VSERLALRLKRSARVAATVAVTAGCVGYLLWKIDLARTAHVVGHARAGYLVAALALLYGTVLPLAWRWRLLLRARGLDDRFAWLVRA